MQLTKWIELEVDGGVRGLQGPMGIPGATGPANTLTIGNVTKGENASASIIGSAPNQILNLVLPKGDKGDKGDTGSIGPEGPSNALTIGTVTSGDSPSASITGASPHQVLNLVLQKGDKGDKGNTGPQGMQGDTGPRGAQGPKGDQGQPGPTGNGISSIDKTASLGLVDTYTVSYTNGSASTFYVTNGATGSQGPEGPQGPSGYTPVRGTDYWTASDIASIEAYCYNLILGALEDSY